MTDETIKVYKKDQLINGGIQISNQ